MDWLKSAFLVLLPHVLSFFVGCLSSLLVARRTRTEKNLSVSLVNRGIIFENFDEGDFDLKYQGTPITNLYVLIIHVWNKGRDRILSSDISLTKPITLQMDSSANIIGTPKIHSPNDGIVFDVAKIEDSSYSLSFDCLNPGDWAFVEFRYTGNPKASVDLSGRIFGQKRDVRFGEDEAYVSWSEWLLTLVVMLFITAILLSFPIALIWTVMIFAANGWKVPAGELPYLLQVFLSFSLFMPILLLFYIIRKISIRLTEPEGYVTPEDLTYSNLDSFKAGWMTISTRKRFVASNSIYDHGQIVTFDPKKDAVPEEPKHEVKQVVKNKPDRAS